MAGAENAPRQKPEGVTASVGRPVGIIIKTTERVAAPEYAVMLDDVRAFLARFIDYPDDAALSAHALWIAHAHLVERFHTTPRLAFLSPELSTGKTTALELTEALTPRAMLAVNPSPSSVFRLISHPDGVPTILLDEIDSIFGHGTSERAEDLRSVLNGGYRRGAVVPRSIAEKGRYAVEKLPIFAPVAMAGLDVLPPTLASRTIIVPMHKPLPGRHREPWWSLRYADEVTALLERLDTFAESVRERIGLELPELPEKVVGRSAEVWWPLLAVADELGGHWPQTARAIALHFIAQARRHPVSRGVRLLLDIRNVIGDRERIGTSELVTKLLEVEESTWDNLDGRGNPLTGKSLALELSKYGVRPSEGFTTDLGRQRGYRRTAFADAWSRYLPDDTDNDTADTDNTDA